MEEMIEDILYFLAVINPASKISYIAAMDPPLSNRQLWRISLRSSGVALGIFILMALSGHFILEYVFRVQLGTLRVAGGIVMFIVGLQMIREGIVQGQNNLHGDNADDISIVPLAAPLIAGPGTITMLISYAALRGPGKICIYITLAVAINMFFMVSSNYLGKFFARCGAMGAVVKLTGLIVAAIAMQMVLQGIGDWIPLWVAAGRAVQ